MKEFILKGLAFFSILAITLAIPLFYLRDRVVAETLLGALPDKHEQLSRLSSPKIIFVGGSNASFGLDTRRIVDTFDMPAYNIGIQASIGLRFIMDDIKKYIQKGDILVLMPEYIQFSQDFSYGQSELVSILFDIYPEGRQHVSPDQWLIISKYIPQYAALKLRNVAGLSVFETPRVYSRNSFNEFGDAYIHWDLKNETFSPDKSAPYQEKLDKEVFQFIAKFSADIGSLGATMVVLPPAYQQTSFQNNERYIKQIETAFREINLPMLGGTARYKFPDSLMFDSPSHLNRKGVALRTSIAIEDLTGTVQRKD